MERFKSDVKTVYFVHSQEYSLQPQASLYFFGILCGRKTQSSAAL